MIAGLGNPGKQYQWTRHNAGFLVLEALLGMSTPSPPKRVFQSELYTISVNGVTPEVSVALLKPSTFMNLSGTAVVPAMRDLRLDVSQLLVIHDEIELEFGDVRLKKGGGHKGHNGLRDIIAKGGGPEFHRLRFGVGRPDHADVAEYVLSKFTPTELDQIGEHTKKAAEKCLEWIRVQAVVPT